MPFRRPLALALLACSVAACDSGRPAGESTDVVVTVAGTCALSAQKPYLYVASTSSVLACVAADGTVDTLAVDGAWFRGGFFQLRYLPAGTLVELFAAWTDRFDTRVGLLESGSFRTLAPPDGAPPPSRAFSTADDRRLLTTALERHDSGVRLTVRVHDLDLDVVWSAAVDLDVADLDVRLADLYGDRAVVSVNPLVPSGSGGFQSLPHVVLLAFDLASGGVTVLDDEAPRTNALVLLDGAVYYASSADGQSVVYRQPLAGGPPERVVDLGPIGDTFVRADVARVGRNEVASLVEDGDETRVVVFDAAGDAVRSALAGGAYNGVEASADGRSLCLRRYEAAWFPSTPRTDPLPETEQFATMDAATLQVVRRDTVALGPAANDGYHFACAVGL